MVCWSNFEIFHHLGSTARTMKRHPLLLWIYLICGSAARRHPSSSTFDKSASLSKHQRNTSRTVSISINDCSPAADARNLVHYHLHKTGGITLNQIFTERYRYKQMHGAGVPSLSDALRNYPNNYYVTYMREPISGLLSRFYFWRLSNEGTHKKYAKVLCHTLHEYMATQASHNFMFRRVIVGQPLGSACRSITTNYSSATSLLSSPSPAAPEAAAVVEKGHRRGLSRSHPSSSKKGRKSSSIKSSAGTSKGGREEEEEEKKMRESAAVWRLGTGNETWREVCPGGRSEADFVDALEETLWRLRGRVFVGVTERFDESLWLFAEQAGRPFFRMSDYTYCPRNVVVGALKPKDLPPHTRQLMSDMNRLDSALVVAAGRVFDRRLACGGAADSYGGGGADSGGGNSSVADSGDAGSDEQGPGEAPAASTPPTNSPREGSLESFVQGLRAYQERLHCTLSEIKANAKGGSMNHAANSNIEARVVPGERVDPDWVMAPGECSKQ